MALSPPSRSCALSFSLSYALLRLKTAISPRSRFHGCPCHVRPHLRALNTRLPSCGDDLLCRVSHGCRREGIHFSADVCALCLAMVAADTQDRCTERPIAAELVHSTHAGLLVCAALACRPPISLLFFFSFSSFAPLCFRVVSTYALFISVMIFIFPIYPPSLACSSLIPLTRSCVFCLRASRFSSFHPRPFPTSACLSCAVMCSRRQRGAVAPRHFKL